MAHVELLLKGYKRFYAKHFLGDKELYERLATGQMPKTLIIGCSDSRVDPAILMDANPGDIFVIRNVANLVPPYQPEDSTYHGTSAALEFGINSIKVEHIVVLGHSGCAGIAALMDDDGTPSEDFSFVTSWVNISKKAKERSLKACDHSSDEKYSVCEKESIITSLENLMTFPWVKDKVENGQLQLHGWYFSIADGKLHMLSEHERGYVEAVVE